MDNQIKINWKAFLQKKLQEEQISPKAQIRIIETVENLFNHLLKSQRESRDKELMDVVEKFEVYNDEPDNCRRIISEVLSLLKEDIKN